MPSNKFWSFKASSDNTGELYLYGEIASSTWWGDEVTPKQFKADLDALGDISELNIYINSPGGDVFAGQTIYSMLKRHEAKKTVYIDGLAASIASVIAMAGDKVIMPKNAMMMIHHVTSGGWGTAEYHRKLADAIDQVEQTLYTVYEEKTGLTKDEIIPMLDAETWLTAEEAVGKGFADEIEESKKLAACIDGGFLMLNTQKIDLSRFKNAPKIEEFQSETEEKQPETEENEPKEPENPQNEPDNGGESQPVADTRNYFTFLRKKILKAYEEEN